MTLSQKQMKMSKTLWIVLLFLLIAFAVWKVDSIRYDRDLELDHIRESGKQWKINND